MPASKPRTNKRSSDESVKAATGKVWKEWFAILDKAGAKKMAHKEIAKHLNEKCKVGPWWCQMVAVAYERERGLREMHQKHDGKYSASASRTMAVPIAKVYQAWVNDSLRKKWIGADKLEISTKTENKSVRGAWNGNKSRLNVGFYAKGPDKTQVALDHEKLGGSKECEQMKDFWFAALDRLQNLLQA